MAGVGGHAAHDGDQRAASHVLAVVERLAVADAGEQLVVLGLVHLVFRAVENPFAGGLDAHAFAALGELCSAFRAEDLSADVVLAADLLPAVAEEFLPIIHLVFSNLKTWLNGIHHGVSPQHLQAYLNEYTFRFNRRFYPFNAFRSLLGIAGDIHAPTYASLYSGEWKHPTCSGGVV